MGPLKGPRAQGALPTVPDGEVGPGDETQGGRAGGIPMVAAMGPGAVATAMERWWGARTAVNTGSRHSRTRLGGRWGGPSVSACCPPCLPHFM